MGGSEESRKINWIKGTKFVLERRKEDWGFIK
jgi:hypothetical protein